MKRKKKRQVPPFIIELAKKGQKNKNKGPNWSSTSLTFYSYFSSPSVLLVAKYSVTNESIIFDKVDIVLVKWLYL